MSNHCPSQFIVALAIFSPNNSQRMVYEDNWAYRCFIVVWAFSIITYAQRDKLWIQCVDKKILSNVVLVFTIALIFS